MNGCSIEHLTTISLEAMTQSEGRKKNKITIELKIQDSKAGPPNVLTYFTTHTLSIYLINNTHDIYLVGLERGGG